MSTFHRSDPIVIHAARDAARAVWLQVRRDGLGRGEWGFDQLPPACVDLEAVSTLRALVVRRHGPRRHAGVDPTQLLLRLPDEQNEHAAVQYTPHVDRTPDGDQYAHVVGVTLTPAPDGTAVAAGLRLGFHIGEVFGWSGDVEHHGLINHGHAPRLTAYWRFR